MISRILSIFHKWLASAERDRMDSKFEKIYETLGGFDDRLDRIESKQSGQEEKVSAIYQVTLANNEALEQKLNRSTVSAEVVREIVDVRINSFQDSLKRLESLMNQLVRRDCNTP